MRKYVTIAITTIFVFAFGFADAQYTFRVLANKGQNQVKKEGASAPVALKTGATLNSGDQLIASQNAYIGLMHKTGKTLEVRTPGVKKISDLEKLVNTKSTSVTNRYAQFLANKMEEKDKPGYRGNLARATGAAERALTGKESIQVLLPPPADTEKRNFISDNVTVSWDSPEGMEENVFIVTVKNHFDEDVWKQEVNGNSVTIDVTTINLDIDPEYDDEAYLISVAAKEKPEVTSGLPLTIVKMKEAQAAPIKEELNSIKAELDEDSPLNHIIFASYYEEKGLLIDALTAIEKAIEMNPDIEDFKVMKKDIVERNGIKLYKEEGSEE